MESRCWLEFCTSWPPVVRTYPSCGQLGHLYKDAAQTFKTQKSTKPVVANKPAFDVSGSESISANVVAVGTGTVDNGNPPPSPESFEGLELC